MTGPVVDSEITSPSGNLANVPYQNLNVSLSLAGKLARVTMLKVKAFSGEIAATGDTRLEAAAPMTASISFTNLDIQQALDAQKSKAAGTVRGSLGGNINVTGKTGRFDEMKPTLKGDGKLTLTNGKLVGVNIGGQALKKVQKLPAIGNLVPDAVVKNHPELFSDPDTDIQLASLSFVLAGPRITSHDIKVQTVDYNLLGDGWFDMDKNIDLAARIVLSPQFSKELIEQKKAVAFIANKDGQIDVPLQIVGQLPKPKVLPDVTELASRAGTHAVQGEGQKYLGKIFGKKGLPGGLGKFLGGDSGGMTDEAAAERRRRLDPPPNPLDQLKKLHARPYAGVLCRGTNHDDLIWKCLNLASSICLALPCRSAPRSRNELLSSGLGPASDLRLLRDNACFRLKPAHQNGHRRLSADGVCKDLSSSLPMGSPAIVRAPSSFFTTCASSNLSSDNFANNLLECPPSPQAHDHHPAVGMRSHS